MLSISRFSFFTLLTLFLLSPTKTNAQSTQVVPDEVVANFVCTVYGHCGDPEERVIVPGIPMGSQPAALANARSRALNVCSNFIETGHSCTQSFAKLRTTELSSVMQEPNYWDVLVTGVMWNGKPIKYFAYGPTFCDAYRMGKTAICIEAMNQCRKVRCYCWKVINKPCCCK